MANKKVLPNKTLKAQWQIWDILQGASSLGVKFKWKILASYDKLLPS